MLDSCRQLEREGYEVTYLDPSESGIISPESVASAIRPDTTLVSLMHVNNEIGVINDIEAIGKITREQKVIFHVDAAQSVGKVNIDLEKMQVDLPHSLHTRFTGQRELVLCMYVVSHVYELRLKCMVVAMSEVCVKVHYLHIKLLEWLKH